MDIKKKFRTLENNENNNIYPCTTEITQYTVSINKTLAESLLHYNVYWKREEFSGIQWCFFYKHSNLLHKIKYDYVDQQELPVLTPNVLVISILKCLEYFIYFFNPVFFL